MDAPITIVGVGPDWPSDEFVAIVQQARLMAAAAPDDAIRYMAHAIPINVLPYIIPAMAAAGGNPGRPHRGLWTDQWPGLGKPEHGMIWIMEDGNRLSAGGDLLWTTYETLTHEMAHALQRDHVLDAMERERQRARGFTAHPLGACG